MNPRTIHGGVSCYPFTLVFSGDAAFFPFVFEGKPFAEQAAAASPICLVSSRLAGDMKFPYTPDTGGGLDATAGAIHGPVREAFFASLGIQRDQVYSLAQVHSRDVFVINDTPAAFAQPGDGMVSFRRNEFLALTAADCLPVFLLDTESGVLAALHSGWKGTGIALRALEIMKEHGTRPQAVAAVLGPCIQSCCYSVDPARAVLFENEFGAYSPGAPYPLSAPVIRQPGVGAFLSMQAVNARLLAAAGVRNIAYCTDCTFTDERLGSFRRQGPRSYTRMLAMTGWFNPRL